MDNKTLIEIDAKDLASPKIEKLQGKMKDASKSTNLLSTAFGDLSSKAEETGVPIQGIQKYIGALGAGGVAAGAVAAVGAVAVGMGVLSFNTIQSTADLKDLSDQTGQSVETLSSMKNVLVTNGVTTEQYADNLSKLTYNLSKNSKELKKFGITAKDPQEAMIQFKKIMAETSDPIKRSEIGMAALGKSYKDMMPFLMMANDEFDEMVGSTTKITTAQAEQAAKLADGWDLIKSKLGSAATTVGLSMMPAMESLMKLMEKLLPILTGTLEVVGYLSGKFILLFATLGQGALAAISAIVDKFSELWKKAKDILGLSDEVNKKESYRTQQFVETRSEMQGQLTPEQQRLMGFGSSTNEEILSGWKPKAEPRVYSIRNTRAARLAEARHKAEEARKKSLPSETPEQRAARLSEARQKAEEARKKSLQAIIDSEQAKIRKAEFDSMVSSRLTNLPGYDQGIKTSTFGTKERTLTAKSAFEEAIAKPEPQTVYDMSPEESAQWILENSLARKEAIDKARKEEQEQEKDAAEKHKKEMNSIWLSVSQTLQSTLEAPFEGLIRAMSRGEANFKDFSKSMVESFGNMLVQMAARLAAYSAIFGIFNMFTGGGFSEATGGFNILKGLGFAANGSDYLPAGWTMVGERGPEMIYNDKPGAKVVSNADMKSIGNKQMTIVNNFNVREVKAKDIVNDIDSYNRRYARYGITTVGA